MYDLCLVECPNLALENPKMYFPLGNLYLSSSVKKAGFDVCIADFRGAVGEFPKSRFYGFSCTTPQINVAKQLAKKVHGKTIVGGAHPSLLPDDCVGSFNYVVRGEGEETLIEILKGNAREGIVNAPRIKALDSIPYPDWDSVEEPFSNTLYTGERYGLGAVSMAVITSRGCPYKCAFCGNIYNKMSFRSPKNIIDELLELMRRDVNHFRFVDDNFTIHPEFDSLCLRIEDLGVKYRCHTRSNLVTPEKAKLLKQSGCEECSIGVESADPHVLYLNGKLEHVDHHKKAIQILKDAGIRVKVYLMSGLPGEDGRSMSYTKLFMMSTKPDKWTLSTFTPYPGCEIFNNPDRFNVEIIDYNFAHWWNFVFNVRDLNLPGREGYVHRLKGQTLEEMKARHDDLYDFLLDEGKWKN